MEKFQFQFFCDPESQLHLLKESYLAYEPLVPNPWCKEIMNYCLKKKCSPFQFRNYMGIGLKCYDFSKNIDFDKNWEKGQA